MGTRCHCLDSDSVACAARHNVISEDWRPEDIEPCECGCHVDAEQEAADEEDARGDGEDG